MSADLYGDMPDLVSGSDVEMPDLKSERDDEIPELVSASDSDDESEDEQSSESPGPMAKTMRLLHSLLKKQSARAVVKLLRVRLTGKLFRPQFDLIRSMIVSVLLLCSRDERRCIGSRKCWQDSSQVL
jgi:hypothetical protein